MADSDSWDADNFEPTEPVKKSVALLDKWEGEDEDEDVKDNWDDDEEEEQKKEEEKAEGKVSEKKKLNEKIKERENKQKKQQEELRKRLKDSQDSRELSPEEEAAEKLRQKKLQEEADMELAREAFGVETNATQKNSVSGIDALNPSSREDFVEFEKLLREKITQYDKSIHYSTFLESLFRELCITLEVEDLRKISTSMTVLLNEKQKQEKQAKGKKKKKTTLAGGGLKAKMRDDLDDYGEFGGGYEQDYEDFM